MKRIIISVVVFATALVGIVYGRTWTDNKGRKITADYVSLLQLDEPKVKLKTPNGNYILVPVRNLSSEDQDYILQIDDNKLEHADSDKSSSDVTGKTPTPVKKNVSESAVYSAVQNMDIDSREAYEALIQLRDSDPTKIEPDYTIALLFIFKKKDYLHAQQHLTRCNKINPDDIGTLINLGTLSILQGKYPEAFSYYQKAYSKGGANQTLFHNLHKVVELSNSHIIILPATARKKFMDLDSEVSKKGSFQFNPKKGWMFEYCSEGTTQEFNKSRWFSLDGYRAYEFPICMKCNGTGKAFCPNKNCSGGKVPYTANVTHRFPNGDTATMPTRKYKTCDVCKGASRVKCSECNGTGFEISKREVASQIDRDLNNRRREFQERERQEAQEKELKELEYALKNRSKVVNECAICIAKVQTVSNVELENAYSGRKSISEDDNYLVLDVIIYNKSSTKKINFDSWAGDRLNMGSKARLVDEYDNTYKRIVFGAGTLIAGNKPNHSIYPENFITDRLVFETPIKTAKKLTLILPGENIGSSGEIKIEFDTTDVQK